MYRKSYNISYSNIFIPVRTEAEPNGVHLILSILLCLRKGVWTFRFRSGKPPFWNPENVLSHEGTLRSRAQWGPFDSFHFIVFAKGCLDLENRLFEILKMSYPSKGLCESRTQWGTFDFLLRLRNGVLTFRFCGGNPPFGNLANILFPDGWMEGISKVSFNCLHTLWVYKTGIYLSLYIYPKIVIKIPMDFKIWCQVGGRHKILNTYNVPSGSSGSTSTQRRPKGRVSNSVPSVLSILIVHSLKYIS